MRLSKIMKFYIATSDRQQKQIADDIGIGASTLTRLVGGKNIDQRSTIKVINWLFEEEE